MKLQNFKQKDLGIVTQFIEARKKGRLGSARLNLSWSNWGFGMEKLETSVQRLSKNHIKFEEQRSTMKQSFTELLKAYGLLAKISLRPAFDAQ